MSSRMRIANLAMLVLFLFWAGFQYNDADALLWMAVYGAAAIQCVLFMMGRLPRMLTLAYLILCIPWAALLAIQIVLSGEFIFAEQGREMFGLLICGGWSLTLYRKTNTVKGAVSI